MKFNALPKMIRNGRCTVLLSDGMIVGEFKGPEIRVFIKGRIEELRTATGTASPYIYRIEPTAGGCHAGRLRVRLASSLRALLLRRRALRPYSWLIRALCGHGSYQKNEALQLKLCKKYGTKIF